MTNSTESKKHLMILNILFDKKVLVFFKFNLALDSSRAEQPHRLITFSCQKADYECSPNLPKVPLALESPHDLWEHTAWSKNLLIADRISQLR